MMRASEIRRLGLTLAACALLVWAGGAIIRRSLADVRMRGSRSLETLERACAIDPDRAACWARLAEARESLGQDGFAAWEQSIARNPRDASALTQAAMSAESRGDLKAAEALLLRAEANNHLWLPRWTLANFYYRHNRKAEFWPWMRAAFERSYGDPAAAFRLCISAGADPSWLLENVVPPAPEILNGFVLFLIQERHLNELPEAAMKYLSRAPDSQAWKVTAAVTAAADTLIGANRPEEALRLWNELANRGLIPYPAWIPEAPLVNGKFQPPLATPAFDWRTPASEGVTAIFGIPAGGVKISLSGQQKVNAEILSQFAMLPPGRIYRFALDYQTRGIPGDDSAFEWRITDADGSGRPLDLPVLSNSVWEHVSARFETPPGAKPRLAKIALIAARKHGRPRMEGEIWVRHLRMEAY